MKTDTVGSEVPIEGKPTESGTSERDEIVRLANTIDVYSPASIQAFGSEIAERTTAYTDNILKIARSSELQDTGSQLNAIVSAAQQFDLDSLDKAVSRTPVIGGFLKRFMMTKEKAMARFDSVKDQVEKLVSRVEKTAKTLDQRNDEFQKMYESVQREYALLGLHVQAVERKLAELNSELASMNNTDGDMEAGERVALLEASRNLLAKRADDLKVLQHSALQTLPTVRIIQSNNLSLVDKFQTIRQLTLPAWKRTFMLALTLDEQKNAVALADSIDDATNAMMRRNADLLHQNSVATAKASQRLVVDLDTLRDVHDKILQTLSDVRAEHDNGAHEREHAIVELERLRKEMTKDVQAIGFQHAQ